MLPTTLPVAITQLERKLLICAWIVLESLLITALASKVFLFSMLLVVALGLVLAPCFWSVYLLTTERNPSLDSLSTRHHRSQRLLLSLITVSSQHIPSWNTLMLLSFLTMRPFMTSVGVRLTLSVLPTPILTDLSLS